MNLPNNTFLGASENKSYHVICHTKQYVTSRAIIQNKIKLPCLAIKRRDPLFLVENLIASCFFSRRVIISQTID